MKIMAVCSTGLGSSFMIELKIKEIMKELGISADVEHSDLSSITPDMADIFVCTKDLAGSIPFENVVAIPNITDKNAMKEKLLEFMKLS
ncbi:PTS sugar transporter subunit IIB [Vibrio natriegens]|uniref:PTS sugar transporter subunit IIB n=1 Tax=Vibrio natriegens TaxID=691 RepID=UPI003555E8F7